MPLPIVIITILSQVGVGLGLLGKISSLTKLPELLKFGKQYMVPKKKSWIELNIGGKIFVTTKSTLLSQPKSIFALMMEIEEKESQDKFLEFDEFEKEKLQGRLNKFSSKGDQYKIDRDFEYFAPILNYLRTGKLIYDSGISLNGLREEAKYYELVELERLIVKEMRKEEEIYASSRQSLRVTRRYKDYFDE
jgi:hypothetical protein